MSSPPEPQHTSCLPDDATAAILFGRLSADQLHDKRSLLAAYTDTWLRKRQTPAIPLEHIFPLLDKAADIVTRARELEAQESRSTKDRHRRRPSESAELPIAEEQPIIDAVEAEPAASAEPASDADTAAAPAAATSEDRPSDDAMATEAPQAPSSSTSSHDDGSSVDDTVSSSSGSTTPTRHPAVTLEGSSAEFLLTEAEHPLTRNTSPKLTSIMDTVNENAKDFVRRLVHATLRDADGYVHSFSSERVDHLIDQIFAHDADLLVHGASAHGSGLDLGDRGRALETALALEWSATQALVYAALNSWRDDEYLFHDNSPSKLEQEEAKAIDSLVSNAAYQHRLEAVRAALASIRTEILHITDQRCSEKDLAAVTLRASEDLGSPPYRTNVEEILPEFPVTAAADASTMEVEQQQQQEQEQERRPTIEDQVFAALAVDGKAIRQRSPGSRCSTPTPTSTPNISNPNLSFGLMPEQPELATEEVMETESDTTPPQATEATDATDATDATADSSSTDAATTTTEGDVTRSDAMATSEASPQDESDSSADISGRNKLRSSSTRLEVQRVASDVERWDDHARRLERLYASLDTKQLLEGDPVEAKKTLQGLHKNATTYIGNLMLDLDALDRLAVSESTRQLRKAQIVQISQLLDSLEAVKHQIEELMRKVDARLAEQQAQAEAKAASEKAQSQPQSPPPQQPQQDADDANDEDSKPRHARKQRRVSVKVDDKEPDDENLFWRRLKLEPHFEVSETRDSFELLSMIPGLNPDEISIKVSDDGSLLTLSGFRGPTAQEKAEMARVLERQRYEQQRLMYGRSAFFGGLEDRRWDDAEMLVRLGAGRFGSFAKSFELPPHGVETNDISATYERGVLRVSVPKTRAYIQKQRQLQQQQQQQQQRQRRQPLPRDMFGGLGPLGRGYPANDFWW